MLKRGESEACWRSTPYPRQGMGLGKLLFCARGPIRRHWHRDWPTGSCRRTSCGVFSALPSRQRWRSRACLWAHHADATHSCADQYECERDEQLCANQSGSHVFFLLSCFKCRKVLIIPICL